jgi:hypothetical protein
VGRVTWLTPNAPSIAPSLLAEAAYPPFADEPKIAIPVAD